MECSSLREGLLTGDWVLVAVLEKLSVGVGERGRVAVSEGSDEKDSVALDRETDSVTVMVWLRVTKADEDNDSVSEMDWERESSSVADLESVGVWIVLVSDGSPVRDLVIDCSEVLDLE